LAGDLQGTSTTQPKRAHLRIARAERADLTEDERTSLAIDLQSTWIATQSANKDFHDNLRAFTALYEMEVTELDEPWVGAANLVLPIIPAELDAMKSYISAQVFVQRLVIVTAADDDPETAKLAPLVEKYYNAELRRIRSEGKTPIEQLKTMLHLGLRDGGAPCDVLFTERVEPKMVVTQEPVLVDDNVVLDDEGMPKTERMVTRTEEIIAEVNIIPRLLKDWSLDPAESTSIQSALGIVCEVWMTEKEMQEKVTEGVFRKEDVEAVLSWVPSGQSDVARADDGSYDKTAGGQISVGLAQGTLTSKFFKNRGPVKLVRVFSEQFDMDEDGEAEKNIFWLYPVMPRLLGWETYEYIDSSWPCFIFSAFPRPDRPHGYSLVERLADIVAEACAGRNQRRNYIDLCLIPLLLQREGDTIRDKDSAFYPGARWTVEDVERSLKWFTPPPLSPDSFSDEARLDVYVSKLSGQNAPAIGAQSSGRRSATESKQQQAAQTVRAADVAMDFRSFIRSIMQFWHKLNKQYLGAATTGLTTFVPNDLAKAYGDKSGGTFTLSPDILARNFNIDIAGLSDPVDASSRRTEFMAALGVIAKAFPWILTDPQKSYELAEAFFDTFQFSAIERFIGTSDEAKQRKEAAQMQAQQQAAQQQQGGAPPPGGAAGASPPQNGQQKVGVP
jgi:hypothetical protein